MIRRLIIFGAAGDLTSRKLLPDVARLRASGWLPDDFQILGVSMDDWDTDRFREHIGQALDRHAEDVKPESRRAVVDSLKYQKADVTDGGSISRAIGSTDEPYAAYLALPPSVAQEAIKSLAAAGVPDGSRVVVEKPFGSDLESAKELNALLAEHLEERDIFRVDHFLGKQTVQNVLGLRFANRIFEPIWNHQNIARVEIIWEETLGLEGRAGYYDSAGALKDMIQNHLMQLLCLIGMEPPLSMGERDLRDRKADLLRAVRKPSLDEIKRETVRARYTAGRIGDQELPAYADEEGVDPSRQTETFAQVTLHIDNWRWSGVPFVLRTGKAMARDRFEILVHFHPVPHLAFNGQAPAPNRLRLGLDPDTLELRVNINGPGNPQELDPISLDTEMAPLDPPAYARLLQEILNGDCSLSIRGDEAEEAWRVVEPILEAWREDQVPLLEYAAGSEGPEEAPLSRN